MIHVPDTPCRRSDNEHGPFGETLRSTGLRASRCNWKISTRYTDAETGWLYYGYRYYGALTGKWLGRDPMNEEGGVSLYALAANDAVSKFDAVGLQASDDAAATASSSRPVCCRKGDRTDMVASQCCRADTPNAAQDIAGEVGAFDPCCCFRLRLTLKSPRRGGMPNTIWWWLPLPWWESTIWDGEGTLKSNQFLEYLLIPTGLKGCENVRDVSTDSSYVDELGRPRRMPHAWNLDVDYGYHAGFNGQYRHIPAAGYISDEARRGTTVHFLWGTQGKTCYEKAWAIEK